jgi:putative transposase
LTSAGFTSALEKRGIKISMDGRGRALDNVFMERLWRTVKYEDVYQKDYETVPGWRRSSSGTTAGGSTSPWGTGTRRKSISRVPRCKKRIDNHKIKMHNSLHGGSYGKQ